MKPKLKHMKRNTQTRKDYQKNLDHIKQTKEYKKKLLKFLIFYCKANPLKFYHKRILPLFDEGKEEELGKLIRDAWVANNPSIRRDQTGFIDNSQFLEAIVDHLIDEIPRIHDEGCEYEDDYDDDNDDDEEGEEEKEEKEEEKEEEERHDILGTQQAEDLEITGKEVEVEEEVDMPKKKRKVSSSKT